jgi:hypothetical protein
MQSEQPTFIVEEIFHRKDDDLQLKVRVHFPVRAESPGVNNGFDWYARFEVERDGQRHEGGAGGIDWLQALHLALEGVRQFIPAAEEDDWRNAAGVSSWMLMPRQVPIGLGWSAYREACEQMDMAIEQWTRRGAG